MLTFRYVINFYFIYLRGREAEQTESFLPLAHSSIAHNEWVWPSCSWETGTQLICPIWVVEINVLEPTVPARRSIYRKLEMEAELRLEHRQSNMDCLHFTCCLTHWAKSLPFTDQFLVNFSIWYEIGVQAHSFACRYLVTPEILIEKTILSLIQLS